MKSSNQANAWMLAYFSGKATPQQVSALEDWLREDAAHVRLFVDLALLDGLMLTDQKNQDAAAILTILGEAEAKAEPDFSLLHTPTHAPNDDTLPAKPGDDPITLKKLYSAASYVIGKGLRTKAAAIGSIAAALLLAVVLYVALIGTGSTPQNTEVANNTPSEPAQPNEPAAVVAPVATITATHNATWSGRPASAGTGEALHPNDRLTLTQGFAEITTQRGAVAILEAPATIELLDSDNAIRLHTGKLVGLCHTESSKGFVVRTEYATIKDLGTEFGVEVRDNVLTTTVFAGAVELQVPDRPLARLTYGQTARLSAAGTRPELTIEKTALRDFTRRLPREGVVTSARTNMPDLQPLVAPRGCVEDAPLYSDRSHQINGVDAGGLPAVLQGGDMVLMPADGTAFYRRQAGIDAGADLALELTVAQAADVYVLTAPAGQNGGRYGDWLERDYVRTSLFVGQDTTSEGGTDNQLGVGPGVSIDFNLEVWKRKQPITGTAFVAGSCARWMYGVVVVPAQSIVN